MKHWMSYALIRAATFPIGLLPYPAVHWLGRKLGSAAYYLLPKFRKRALSNLSLAAGLDLSLEETVRIAKESFQNLMITCLEYPKFAREKNIGDIVRCENPEAADAIMKEGKGLIFFCGHQSNWEVLFLDGSSRMPGVAIGRPIKNEHLYRWIVSIREKWGGQIIGRQNGAKEGLKALRRGGFLGIVGDQGMPDSGYSSPFFGRNAWTSPMPAILSYRRNTPIIVATTRREKGTYLIHYSDPIRPNLEEPMEKEVDRMMRESLKILEESIRKSPGEWLWQHNRWKQQTLERVKKPFRQESICIILPENNTEFHKIRDHLPALREIYPYEFITLMVPKKFWEEPLLEGVEKYYYRDAKELLISDFRFKLIFDFADIPEARKHFLKLSAFKAATLADLHKMAGPSENLSEVFHKALTHAR